MSEEKKVKIGNVWVTEQEAATLYDDLMDSFSGRTHFVLRVIAKLPTTDIYVADLDGNLVVKGTGRLEETLEKGFYDIHFHDPNSPAVRTRLSSMTEVCE